MGACRSFVAGRRIGDDAFGRQVHGRHRRAGEGQQNDLFAADDFQNVARAVIKDRPDPAQNNAAGIYDLQPDQVGVIEFIIGKRGQGGAGRPQGGAQLVRASLLILGPIWG